MKKKAKDLKRKVFFNASVILAGLKSPQGGSAKILSWAKQGGFLAFISEIIVDEVERNLKKLELKKEDFEKLKDGFIILPSPTLLPEKYQKLVKDEGDLHLFTSAKLAGADYLVSLDQKHILSLATKVTEFKIVSPAQLIEVLMFHQFSLPFSGRRKKSGS